MMPERINYLGDLIGSLSKIEIREGDRFIMMTDAHISNDEATRIKKAWVDFVGDNNPLLIIADGFKLAVLSSTK